MSAPAEGQTLREDTLVHIQAEPIMWVRLAAIRKEDQLVVALLEVTSGAAPPAWEVKEWEYPDVLFVALQLTGPQIAQALDERLLDLGGRLITMPELMTQHRWERHQSGHIGTYQPLEWPAWETQLVMTSGSHNEPQGHLISPGEAPSFVNFYTAAKWFFWLGGFVVGGAVNQGAVYRHQDLEARITRVRVIIIAVVPPVGLVQ